MRNLVRNFMYRHIHRHIENNAYEITALSKLLLSTEEPP